VDQTLELPGTAVTFADDGSMAVAVAPRGGDRIAELRLFRRFPQLYSSQSVPLPFTPRELHAQGGTLIAESQGTVAELLIAAPVASASNVSVALPAGVVQDVAFTNDGRLLAKMEDGDPQVSDAAAAQHWQAVSPEEADRLDPGVTIPNAGTNASELVRAAMTPGADLVAWASPEPGGMLTLVSAAVEQGRSGRATPFDRGVRPNADGRPCRLRLSRRYAVLACEDMARLYERQGARFNRLADLHCATPLDGCRGPTSSRLIVDAAITSDERSARLLVREDQHRYIATVPIGLTDLAAAAAARAARLAVR
jgi:hypothetical protein